MKTIITGKNYTPSDKLKETIEKKFAKLDKYFSDEITGNVMTIKENLGDSNWAAITTNTRKIAIAIAVPRLRNSSKSARCPKARPA